MSLFCSIDKTSNPVLKYLPEYSTDEQLLVLLKSQQKRILAYMPLSALAPKTLKTFVSESQLFVVDTSFSKFGRRHICDVTCAIPCMKNLYYLSYPILHHEFISVVGEKWSSIREESGSEQTITN